MRHAFTLSASCLLLTLAGSAIAQAVEFAQRDPAFPPREYTCRLDGKDMPLGAQRCLRTPQGQQTAECGVVLNMSSWQPVRGACD